MTQCVEIPVWAILLALAFPFGVFVAILLAKQLDDKSMAITALVCAVEDVALHYPSGPIKPACSARLEQAGAGPKRLVDDLLKARGWKNKSLKETLRGGVAK